MTEGLVTVIVPIYNAEAYLERCVSSLLKQSYEKLEIFLIDDGSSDRSGEIADKLASEDGRIRAIHQKNAGVSRTRNCGIELAQGEWISFIDADDYVSEDYIERLIPHNDGVQISLCGMTRIFPDGRMSRWNLYKKGHVESEGTVNCSIQEMMTEINFYALTGPTCKLFKNSIIQKKKLRFPLDMSFGEDSVFVFSYLLYVQTVQLVNKWLYYYYNAENSLVSKAKSKDRLLVAHRIYELSLEICKKNEIQNMDSVQYHYVNQLMYVVASEKNSAVRYGCYEEISQLLGTESVRKSMPFYFPFFAKIRRWSVYENLNALVYGKYKKYK